MLTAGSFLDRRRLKPEIPMKISPVVASFTAAMAAASSLHASVLAYEGFGGAVTGDGTDINGYTPGTASSGLTGSWTRNGGAATTKVFRPGGAGHFLGIDGGYSPNVESGDQTYMSHRSGWGLSRNTVTLSTSLDLSVDGTYHMSFFARSSGVDVVTQLGLTDGTDELMFGRGYGGASTKGITSYYGTIGSAPMTNANGTEFANGRVFYVAKLEKTHSTSTHDLTLSIAAYDLNTSTTIDSGDPSTWLRSSTFTGVDNVFTQLQFKVDGAAWPDMDEFRLGESWLDVTGVPEPSSLALLGLGGVGLVLRRRR